MFALFCVILRCKGTTKISFTQEKMKLLYKFRQSKNKEI